MDTIEERKKDNTIKALTDKLQDLPMLPAVVAKLMALSPNDDDFFEKVLELAHDDPPFSVRLIQLANSASQSPASPITTLPVAVARIGAQSIVSLIFSMAVLRVFVPSTQGQRNLWIHAIQVAIASRTIAKLAPSLKVDPEQAYLCGLMHDIGRFVLFDESIEELGRVDETNWTTPQQLIEAEIELCGFNHAELGWHACQKWGLPKVVELCVKQHHNYSLNVSNPKFNTNPVSTHIIQLIQIVQVADFFSVLIMLEKDVLLLRPKELEQIIAKSCFPDKWNISPCTAKQLQAEAINIQEEATDILSSLGIRVES